MTTFTDGPAPSVTPEPDDRSGRSDRVDEEGRAEPDEPGNPDEVPDPHGAWLYDEIQRRIAEGRTGGAARHARRGTPGSSPATGGYVPRHSVATPGPGAPRPGPVGGQMSAQAGELLRRERTSAPAWSGPPERAEHLPEAPDTDPGPEPGGSGAVASPAAELPVVEAPEAGPAEDGAAPDTSASARRGPGVAAAAAMRGAARGRAAAAAPGTASAEPVATEVADEPVAPAPVEDDAPVDDGPVDDAAPVDSPVRPDAPTTQVPTVDPATDGTAAVAAVPTDAEADRSDTPDEPPAALDEPAVEELGADDELVAVEENPAEDTTTVLPRLVTSAADPDPDGAEDGPEPVAGTALDPNDTERLVRTAAVGPANPVSVPAQRAGEQAWDADPEPAADDPASRRVRVVLSERKGVARPVRTVVDIQEGTGVGELLRTNLIGSQLAVALRFAACAGLTLGVLPLLFAILPEIGRTELFGIRLPWLLLGVLVYPFLFGIGVWQARAAERVEQNFADHVQD